MPEFENDACKQWDLDRLYNDFERVKRDMLLPSPSLTEREKELLCSLLIGLEPKTIAEEFKITLGTVTATLSSTIYRYVEQLTDRERLSLRSWRDVVDWLEEAGYQKSLDPASFVFSDWDQMPELTTFYGRAVQLDQLRKRVLSPDCRMVSIIGHAGMGKTSLAVKLVETMGKQFEWVGIWQSLRYAPTLDHVLGHWLSLMLGVGDSEVWYNRLKVVMDYLRTHRCLIVIDNLESILDAEHLGGYKADYSPFREFFKRLGEEKHQSCVVVTSRCHSLEIHGFADGPVQDIVLSGLSQGAAQQLLADQRLPNHTKAHWPDLIQLYRGNPLMLKMASRYIVDMFDKDVSKFLKCSKTILSRDLRALVGQLLTQLSQDEKDVLKQLVEQNRPMPIEEIQNPQRIDAVSTLLNRCLLEKTANGVMPIPVVVDYIQNFATDCA